MASALIILSGGMDSGVLLAESTRTYSSVSAVSFDYGAKHNARELPLASALAQKYEIKHSILSLEFLNSVLSSSLLSSGASVPDGSYAESNMRSTVVPFRNGIMLSVGVALAENDAIDYVLIGSHAGDVAVYPDCRPEFTDAFSRASERGTYHGVRVLAPFGHLTKTQIAERGRNCDFDFRLTWTCYKGREKHCGTCAACRERHAALESALGYDPTEYET